MSPEWFTKIVELLKSPRLSAVGVLITAAALWFPRRFLPPGAVAPDKFQVWVFVAFVVCTAALVVNAIAVGWSFISHKVTRHQIKSKMVSRLNNLSPDEQHVLYGYLAKRTVTQYLEIDSGIVGSLLGKNLVRMGARVGRFNTFAVNIDEEALQYLQEHPEVVSNPSAPGPTPAERMQFRSG